jgi:16S rRNA (uracil1498-N3)-methyltransferase
VKKNAVLLEIGEIQYAEKSTPEIILAQAIPKGKTMDWIVEKAVELGVSRIIPLITRYTVVKYDASEAPRKAEKWQKIAMEACKQCGQNWMPIVETPIDWNYYINRSNDGLKIIASLADGATSLRELLEKNFTPQQATILIGPEGDFTSEETAAAINKGFHPVTLGDIVLRTETASLFCLAAVRCRYL